jgi:hypothetical protein
VAPAPVAPAPVAPAPQSTTKAESPSAKPTPTSKSEDSNELDKTVASASSQGERFGGSLDPAVLVILTILVTAVIMGSVLFAWNMWKGSAQKAKE